MRQLIIIMENFKRNSVTRRGIRLSKLAAAVVISNTIAETDRYNPRSTFYNYFLSQVKLGRAPPQPQQRFIAPPPSPPPPSPEPQE